MNAADLYAAERALGAMVEGPRDLAKKRLAGAMRKMGLVATLEWLRSKEGNDGAALAGLVEAHIGVTQAGLGRTDNVRFLEAIHRAHRFAEALHVVARAGRRTS